MKPAVLGSAVLALALAAGAAAAHHSGAMFDRDKTLTLNGTVREFQWINPHVWIILDVPGADGKNAEWHIEGISPAQLGRRGWKKSSLKSGDKVEIQTHPVKSGALEGSLVRATVNGTVIGQ